MLKIKDNIDLKELEKFGFIEDDGDYYYDFMKYSSFECSYLCVTAQRTSLTEYTQYEHITKMADLLFDLIVLGLVEKVGE